jgi:hypothetical protein
MEVGVGDTEPFHVLEVGACVGFRDFERVHPFELRPTLDLVFALVRVVEQVADVGDVLDVLDLVAEVAEVPDDGVERHVRLRVAEMRVAVDGRAARVDPHMTGHERDEALLEASQGVDEVEVVVANRHGVMFLPRIGRVKRTYRRFPAATNTCPSSPAVIRGASNPAASSAARSPSGDHRRFATPERAEPTTNSWETPE